MLKPRPRSPTTTPCVLFLSNWDVLLTHEIQRSRSQIEQILESEPVNYAMMGLLTALAFALRFYKINNPDQVVCVLFSLAWFVSYAYTEIPRFDEVHFGKFAAQYIKREYYFDVHPPFAKMLFGLAGWFVGFNGEFSFENIGDSYTDHHVPYVGMRALPAILGSLTIPLVYAIMKETGYATMVAAFSACLVLFGEPYLSGSAFNLVLTL
jgi:dolichyl-phosphate-mannose-protein mannosyltransferase